MSPLTRLLVLLLISLAAGQAYGEKKYPYFAIDRQPVSSALAEFGLQAGVIIALGESRPSAILANPLRGRMSPERGLRKLLRNTGYAFEILADNKIRVFPLPAAKPPPQNSTPKQQLEEIVISTQRREQPSLHVPIATSVFFAEQLNNPNISNIKDLASHTPGMVATQFSYANPTFNIRGAQNSFSSVGSSEPTGIFLDEIYISRFSASDLQLFDLQQAVIVRGPQGTLFGRNVTSGAILLFSEPPDPHAVAGKISLATGNLQFRELKATANLPLGAATAVRISGVQNSRNGYGRDLLSNREQDDADSGSARLQLLSQISAASQLTFSMDYSRDQNHGRTLTTSRIEGLNIRHSLLGVAQGFDREITGGSLKINTQLDAGQFTSITGYRQADTTETFSRSDLSYRLLESGSQEIFHELERPETLSQEFRFVSNDSGHYNFVAGVYLFFEHSDRHTQQIQLAAQTGVSILQQLIFQSALTRSYAVYFDHTLSVRKNLDLTLGARYTYETKTATIRLDQQLTPAASFAAKAQASWEKLTPRIVLSWHKNDNAMFYASYTQGFTAGGFNTEAASPEAFASAFEPEQSDAFELGANTRWFDNRLTADLVLFRQRYIDKQEFSRRDIHSPNTILNAAKATTDGVELEAAWHFNDYFRVAATYAYLNARYDKFLIPHEVSRAGNRLPGAPRHQYSLTLDANRPFFHGVLSASLAWAWQDNYTPGSSNTRFFPAYGLLDGRLSFQPDTHSWRVTCWANNLLDRDYQLATTDFANSDGAWYAPPRLFGITAEFSFGG